jgi:hypothetical protein
MPALQEHTVVAHAIEQRHNGVFFQARIVPGEHLHPCFGVVHFFDGYLQGAVLIFDFRPLRPCDMMLR